MRDLIPRIIDGLANGRSLACCRLVETRGSTPQKAGAMMVLLPDGSQWGTIGGGCVEAEVKRRALSIIEQGRAEVVHFQLDSDYGWDDGLICGGRMHVLIDPISDRGHFRKEAQAYYQKLGQMIEQSCSFTEAIVFDSEKAGLPASACYLLDENANILATHNVPEQPKAVPEVIRTNLKPVANRPRGSVASGVSFLPLLSKSRLLIVGGGHVGQAVAKLAAELDFDVSVIDDRQEFVTEERFPMAKHRHHGPIDLLKEIAITPETYCIIVTRGHNHDEEALYHLAQRGAAYVGMIGSKRKIKLIYDDLLGEGIPAEALGQVYAPLGIDIGSQTVAEIAISIAAELVAHRNRGSVLGRPDPIPVLESK